MGSLKNRIAIAGVGETALGKVPNKSTMQFHVEATRSALEDAGLTKGDIDGILTWNSTSVDPMPYYFLSVAEYMGIPLRYGASLDMGGATFCSAVAHAGAAILTGMCETVLIVTADNRLTGRTREGKKVWEERGRKGYGHPEFEAPFGPTLISLYALAAQRHMHEYGTTPEQLAEVAVTCRRHAALTPNAQMKEPITIADVLNSPMVSSPLHLLDCCIISDGGAAIIVTSSDRAKDLRKPPVYVLGAGEGHQQVHVIQMPDLTTTAATVSGPRAFAMAGLSPRDLDFAQLYDCFTIMVILLLEDLGFCKKGEGGPFVQGGRIGLGGALPVNTDGGGLSHCQHASSGPWHILEAVRQLRGERGAAQVPDARLGLVHTNGGSLSTQSTLILGREPL